MYGLISRFVAQPGRRDALVAAITSDVGVMPGCRSFVVAHDCKDADAVWITEVWDTQPEWETSTELPEVKASIEATMPLIRNLGETVATKVVFGHGL
jgi:quinol monooxygenase YgiN